MCIAYLEQLLRVLLLQLTCWMPWQVHTVMDFYIWYEEPGYSVVRF